MRTNTPVGRKTAAALGATALALTLGAGIGTGTSYADQPSDARSAGVAADAAKPKFQMPFKCDTVWQLNTWGHNPAIDIVVNGNPGSDGRPVYPGYPGTVVKASYDTGAGNMIIIKHGGGWYTAYYHLQDEPTRYVDVGEQVGAKTQIGRIGSTGSNGGSWAHLHYEQRYKEKGIPTQEDREAVDFNGRTYTGHNEQWTDVVSKNC
ncbi:M23 family metallopeptidase [Streptomyces europaeiscabiei]|uniref:M23 family metallopeptidase n=1 Tax=Streptomyces europaeiscabiei TaxID=146819 RepID=UPI000E69C416|nr:M23 family metallopeptidase [Streptomyces europaeiscabiei]MDX2772866.1 M23 family metallopeptidase [Streptomyces europaeiscabiei]